MGEGQFGGVDNLATEVDEVDINCPGSVPDHPDPSEIVFNGMHPPGKVKWIEFCLKNRHLIKELERGEFGRHIDRFGLNDGTRLHELRLGQGRQRRKSPFQILCSRLDIGSEGDDGPLTWPWGVRR